MPTNTVPFSDKSTCDVQNPGWKTTKAKHESANDSEKSYVLRMRVKERMRDRCDTALVFDFLKQRYTDDDFSKSTR